MPRIRVNVLHAGCPIGESCRCPEARAAVSRQVREAIAVGVLAVRLWNDPRGRLDAWKQDGVSKRHEVARGLLTVRLRLNRAGLLRWRMERPEGGEG